MTTQRITPDMVEFVPASLIVEGDTLINFTPIGKDVSIPPTQAQLSRLRADRMWDVTVITSPRANILDFGTGPNRWTFLESAKVWRIKH